MADDLVSLFQNLGTSDHEVLLEQFCKIMNCEPNVGRFFLESASWNVEVAVNAFISTVGAGTNIYKTSTPPQAAFDQTGTIPQGFKVPCGAPVQAVWRFKNTGKGDWPTDTKLVHTDGQRFALLQSHIAQAKPGQIFSLPVSMVMPSSPGDYYGQWRLTCGSGFFGDPVWVIVSVVPGGTGAGMTAPPATMEGAALTLRPPTAPVSNASHGPLQSVGAPGTGGTNMAMPPRLMPQRHAGGAADADGMEM